MLTVLPLLLEYRQMLAYMKLRLSEAKARRYFQLADEQNKCVRSAFTALVVSKLTDVVCHDRLHAEGTSTSASLSSRCT